MFREHLNNYHRIGDHEWSAHFPQGYRERLAPEFLAEVYAKNATGEEWGRQLLSRKDMLGCYAARELPAALAAIDAVLLEERDTGALGRVSVEKLARKAYALVLAFEPIQKEADWKKPKGADAKWKSKIDWESARRHDPALVSTSVPHIRAVEEETKKEMERDATIEKVRAKLDERKGVMPSHFD